MPISRRLLGDDEEVLIDLRPHWGFLFGPIAALVGAIVAVVAIAVKFPHSPSWVGIIFALILAGPALWSVGRIVRWLGVSLIVTNTRLVLRKGVFGRDMVQIRLSRINEIQSSQTLGQRIIGSGRLIVEVQGEDGALSIDHIRNPRVLQRVLTDQLNHFDDNDPTEVITHRSPNPAPFQSPPAPLSPNATPPQGMPAVRVDPPGPPTAANSAPPSIADQLIALDDLRRRGIITEDEFVAKKAELLSRL